MPERNFGQTASLVISGSDSRDGRGAERKVPFAPRGTRALPDPVAYIRELTERGGASYRYAPERSHLLFTMNDSPFKMETRRAGYLRRLGSIGNVELSYRPEPFL